jgi:hypothetical protein
VSPLSRPEALDVHKKPDNRTAAAFIRNVTPELTQAKLDAVKAAMIQRNDNPVR